MLAGLKTPTLKQGYGHSVKEYVVKTISNKKIQIVDDFENLGIRYVEILIDSNTIFNIKMLKDGWAWYDSNVLKNTKYQNAGRNAQKAKVGLWRYDVKKPWSLP
jgi:hypothetical protein